MPGHGTQLDAVVMNNDPLVNKLAVRQFQNQSSCESLAGGIDLSYTVYHPHLAYAELLVQSNNGQYSAHLGDAGKLPLRDNQQTQVHLNNPSLPVPAKDDDGSPLIPCVYGAQLKAQRRLHDGRSSPSDHIRPSTVSFHKE